MQGCINACTVIWIILCMNAEIDGRMDSDVNNTQLNQRDHYSLLFSGTLYIINLTKNNHKSLLYSHVSLCSIRYLNVFMCVCKKACLCLFVLNEGYTARLLCFTASALSSLGEVI